MVQVNRDFVECLLYERLLCGVREGPDDRAQLVWMKAQQGIVEALSRGSVFGCIPESKNWRMEFNVRPGISVGGMSTGQTMDLNVRFTPRGSS